MARRIPDINRGTTYTIQGFYTGSDGSTDITGATVFFTIKSEEYDTDSADSSALVLKNITAFTDAAGGEYAIELDPEDTEGITPGDYYFDVSIKLADDSIHELDEGRVRIDASPRNRLSA